MSYQTLPALYSMAGMAKEKYVNLVSGLTNFQLAKTPWADPLQQGIRVLKILDITITNPAQSGTALWIWDQDLDSTTPTSRGSGSANGALISVGIGGATAGQSGTGNTLTLTGAQIPKQTFQAGIAMMGTYPGMTVSAHVVID